MVQRFAANFSENGSQWEAVGLYLGSWKAFQNASNERRTKILAARSSIIR